MAKIGVIDINYFSTKAADVCPNCRCMREFEIKLYQGAFLIGLPLFPTDKKQIVTCTSCKTVFATAQLPKFIQDKLQKSLQAKKPSPWYYSFSYLTVILMVFVTIKKNKDNNEYSKYINNPKVNDVYVIEKEDLGILSSKPKYTLLKVIDYTNSEIIFTSCPFEVPQKLLDNLKAKDDDLLWKLDTVIKEKVFIQEHLGTFSNTDKSFVVTEIIRK